MLVNLIQPLYGPWIQNLINNMIRSCGHIRIYNIEGFKIKEKKKKNKKKGMI